MRVLVLEVVELTAVPNTGLERVHTVSMARTLLRCDLILDRFVVLLHFFKLFLSLLDIIVSRATATGLVRAVCLALSFILDLPKVALDAFVHPLVPLRFLLSRCVRVRVLARTLALVFAETERFRLFIEEKLLHSDFGSRSLEASKRSILWPIACIRLESAENDALQVERLVHTVA